MPGPPLHARSGATVITSARKATYRECRAPFDQRSLRRRSRTGGARRRQPRHAAFPHGLGVGQGLGFGLATLLARRLGAGRHSAASAAANTVFAAAVPLGLVFGLAVHLVIPFYLEGVGASADTLTASLSYADFSPSASFSACCRRLAISLRFPRATAGSRRRGNGVAAAPSWARGSSIVQNCWLPCLPERDGPPVRTPPNPRRRLLPHGRRRCRQVCG
jgi:hypothetical protein